ncbi:alpha/beta fold hydrolase [Rhodococcus hoagii]|uniref:Monoacylglycerol lipase n=2 Tax=Rhodococcus hoagii TaxID=43767 RepID=E9T7E8_RHOHA|nr:alpha/beta hydrolase [Prescottella equi]MCD7050880.1 alpha/beta hydrolase [Rhodococcus sp. BH2-1]AVP70318.1 alpha/beta hydrolase [Prescottella equi]EGD21648.1 hydrolase, alpha/beta domain protein [Prescottella equi ATCC 33707]ERN43819.1 alpha/beta hydrolase [Prescottella equi NBRC 101255 = C 7]MBM4472111.1 alpha/beta fold hydrolase [Prescottella equi]
MQHTESEFAGVHGTRIVYDVWRPDGPPTGILLLAHGLGEHARRYDHVVERLVGLGLVVYAPDHRGHGRSGGKRIELHDWSEFLDDLHRLSAVAIAENPGLQRFLLGHSMGGAIALSYALDHQDELSGLILSAPAVDVVGGKPRVVIEIGKILGRFAPGIPVETLDAKSVSRDPAVVAAYESDPLVHHGKVKAGIARGMILAAESFPARLPSLTIPVLLLHGTEDRLADVSGSRMIAAHAGSKDLTLKTYDGLFHEVFNEPEQEKVLDDLVDWLRPRLE